MTFVFLGSISGDQLEVLVLFYLLLTLFCLYLVIKKEYKLSFLLWSLVILIFPIVGSLIYLSKWLILRGRAQ